MDTSKSNLDAAMVPMRKGVRPRKANFIDVEIRTLLAEYNKHRDILNRSGAHFIGNDPHINRVRDQAWESITKQVNQVAEDGVFRTVKEVKKKVSSLKVQAKKEKQDSRMAQSKGQVPPEESWFTEQVMLIAGDGDGGDEDTDKFREENDVSIIQEVDFDAMMNLGDSSSKYSAKSKARHTAPLRSRRTQDGNVMMTQAVQPSTSPSSPDTPQGMVSKQRQRMSNFTLAETTCLLEEVLKHIRFLRHKGNKQGNVNVSALKNRIWKAIANRVSKVSQGTKTRSAHGVKKKYHQVRGAVVKMKAMKGHILCKVRPRHFQLMQQIFDVEQETNKLTVNATTSKQVTPLQALLYIKTKAGDTSVDDAREGADDGVEGAVDGVDDSVTSSSGGESSSSMKKVSDDGETTLGKTKRIRKNNFSPAECSCLISELEKRKHVLLPPSTTCIMSNMKKRQAWGAVAMNVSKVDGVKRTIKEVKKKWSNLKKSVYDYHKGVVSPVTIGNTHDCTLAHLSEQIATILSKHTSCSGPDGPPHSVCALGDEPLPNSLTENPSTRSALPSIVQHKETSLPVECTSESDYTDDLSKTFQNAKRALSTADSSQMSGAGGEKDVKWQIQHHLNAIAQSCKELKTLGVDLKIQVVRNGSILSSFADMLSNPSQLCDLLSTHNSASSVSQTSRPTRKARRSQNVRIKRCTSTRRRRCSDSSGQGTAGRQTRLSSATSNILQPVANGTDEDNDVGDGRGDPCEDDTEELLTRVGSDEDIGDELENLPVAFSEEHQSKGSYSATEAEFSIPLPPLDQVPGSLGQRRGSQHSDSSSQSSKDIESNKFCCEECGKLFADNSRLVAHRRTHRGIKPFTCDQCPRVFSSRRNWKTHKERHLGIVSKPFQCDVCGQRFTAKNNMKTHLRIHTGDKPHKCEFCGESFVAPIQLKFHRAKHTGYRPYVCDICGKGFVEPNRLRKHQNTHSSEKLFCCMDCDKSFTEKRGLDLHMRLHMEDSPYKCPVCGKPGQSAYKLQKHMKTHTSAKNLLQ